MDLSVAFSHLNWLAVTAAALASFMVGGLWYSPMLFARIWMRANGFTPESLGKGNMSMIFGTAFVLSFVVSFVLALFVVGIPNMQGGVMAAALTALGWVLPMLGILYLFERRPFTLFWVNGGYILLSFLLQGLILSAWK